MTIFGARCFEGSMPLLIPSHTLQTCGSREILTSTTIVSNVMENQLGKEGTPHIENLNLPTLLRKKQEVQLPWPRKLGQCQQGPLAIGLKSEFPSPM